MVVVILFCHFQEPQFGKFFENDLDHLGQYVFAAIGIRFPQSGQGFFQGGFDQGSETFVVFLAVGDGIFVYPFANRLSAGIAAGICPPFIGPV
jgi:hypothetical protein